jgi:prepilin-type processing-associated H-X9-DG protein
MEPPTQPTPQSPSPQPAPPKPQVLDYASPAAAETRVSRVSVSALVCALAVIPTLVVGFALDSGVVAILSIALAPISVLLGLRGWRDAPQSRRSRVAAIVAMTLGGVLFALLAASIVMIPTGGVSRERANRVKCASNLRQIGIGLIMYANDFGGVLPPDLGLLIIHEDLSSTVFTCPSTNSLPSPATTQQAARDVATNPAYCDFVYVAAGLNLKSLPADFILAHERPSNHSPDGGNILFADGHADWFPAPEFQRLLAELAAGHNPPRPPTTRP